MKRNLSFKSRPITNLMIYLNLGPLNVPEFTGTHMIALFNWAKSWTRGRNRNWSSENYERRLRSTTYWEWVTGRQYIHRRDWCTLLWYKSFWISEGRQRSGPFTFCRSLWWLRRRWQWCRRCTSDRSSRTVCPLPVPRWNPRSATSAAYRESLSSCVHSAQ